MSTKIVKAENKPAATSIHDKLAVLLDGYLFKLQNRFFKFINSEFYEINPQRNSIQIVNHYFNFDFLAHLDCEIYYEKEITWVDELENGKPIICWCNDNNLHEILSYDGEYYYDSYDRYKLANPVYDVNTLHLLDVNMLPLKITQSNEIPLTTVTTKLAALVNGHVLYHSDIGHYKLNNGTMCVFDGNKFIPINMAELSMQAVADSFDNIYIIEPVNWKTILNGSNEVLCWVTKGSTTVLRDIISYTRTYNQPFKDSNGDTWEDATPVKLSDINIYVNKN